MTAIHLLPFGELDALTLYALLRLRVDVFVVEQACPYAELDGRDTEPGMRHGWVEDAGRPVACLRLLAESDGAVRLGRVATARDRRGEGHAGLLVTHALSRSARPVRADVQSHLTAWYARFGFEVHGQEFIEDGISHVPMRLGPAG